MILFYLLALLPKSFCIAFDGWTLSTTHYVALCAYFPDRRTKLPCKVLLAFAPLLDESCFDHQEHLEFLKVTLSSYGKSLMDVICLVGDNCNTNVAFARAAGLPFVGMRLSELFCSFLGCACHRFNLAVMRYLESFAPLLKSLIELMKKLRTLKVSGMPL